MRTRSIQTRLVSLLFLSLCLVGISLLSFFEMRLYNSELSNKKKICQLIALQEQKALTHEVVGISKAFSSLSDLGPTLVRSAHDGNFARVRDLLGRFETRNGVHAVGLILKNSRILSGGKSWVIFKKLAQKISSSRSTTRFWWAETKTFVFSRPLKIRGGFRGHLVALMEFEPIQKRLKSYHQQLRDHGFKTCSVFLRGEEFFTGENLSFGHFDMIRPLSREVGFERMGGHYLSMLGINLPGGQKAYLGSLIPQYEILSEVYQTGFIALLATLVILSTLIIFISHRTRDVLNSLDEGSLALSHGVKNLQDLSGQAHLQQQGLITVLSDRLISLEAPATLMDEVVSASKITFQKTTEFQKLILSSGDDSKQGLEILQGLMQRSEKLGLLEEAMREIMAKMKELSNKIDIVAINASIEAARAGEKGRDFAEVADEIARLAQNSLEQSEQLEICIQDSLVIFKANTEDSRQAETCLSSLSEDMQTCSKEFGDVAEESRQQSERVFHLNRELMTIGHDISRARQMVEISAHKNQEVLKEAEQLIEKSRSLNQRLAPAKKLT